MKLFFTLVFLSALYAASAQGNPSLSAAFDKTERAVKLRWQHSDNGITAYILQRSADNGNYVDIYTQKTGELEANSIINFTDRDIHEGKNYYRVKILRSGYSYEATMPLIIMTGASENAWIIYPVPVTSMLNLQYTGSGKIEGVITVIIQSVSSGTVFARERMASTTRNIQIPVNNLGNGLYDIHVFIGSEVVWNQRFVK